MQKTRIFLGSCLFLFLVGFGLGVVVGRLKPVVQQSSPAPTPVDETASWKRFNSKLVNLSFSYPRDLQFQERDIQKVHTGKDVNFEDLSKVSSGFEAITKDFTVTDVVPHDIVKGDLSSENSFKVAMYDDRYLKVIKKGTGIYQVVGYETWECSPSVESFLLVAPPLQSGLKYVSFPLGGASDFVRDDFSKPCLPKDSVIKSKINSILSGQVTAVNNNLDLALKIAKTFSSKN